MMNRLATRTSRIGSLVLKFRRNESEKFLFHHREITCVNCKRGYILTCNNENLRLENINNNLTVSYLNNRIGRTFSTEEEAESINFVKISTETLESLSEYFDEIIEEANHLSDADVSLGDGVLTIKFGGNNGTYVINRQVPNLQIWLSSPKSGPKRYDFIDNTWIYKHDGKTLHELLDEEIPEIVKSPVSFSTCSYGLRKK